MLKPLTSLRFAAALLVFLWHCPVTRPYGLLFSTGYAGVSFFFLLSGFILIYTYDEKFAEVLNKKNILAFYRARFARIYPLHIFAALLVLFFLIRFGSPPGSLLHWDGEGSSVRLAALLTQAVLIQSWFPAVAIHFGINGPDWSVADEAFFYACFPFIAWFLLRCLKRANATVVLSAAFAIWASFTAAVALHRAAPDEWALYALPVTRLVDFVAGVLIGIAFVKSEARRPAWRYPTAQEFAALLAVCVAIVVSPLLPASLRFSAAFMPFFGAVIYLFAHQAGALSKASGNRVFVRLGEVSFAFYMVHLGVMLAYGSLIGWSHPLRDFAAAFAITLALAWLLFTFVETPLRRYIRRATVRAPLTITESSPIHVGSFGIHQTIPELEV